jgi:hypothetical protein
MQTLIQIIYISRSTFTPSGLKMGIEPNVARILSKSRINNRRDGLVGVLYFGDSCFFQCLEGNEAAVDALYERLQSDNRHKDIKLLSRKVITALSYADWAMKFVPLEKKMTRLLDEGGYKSFDPYQFDDQMIRKTMALLQASTDPTGGTEVADLIQLSAGTQVGKKADSRWVIFSVIAAVLIVGGLVVLQMR